MSVKTFYSCFTAVLYSYFDSVLTLEMTCWDENTSIQGKNGIDENTEKAAGWWGEGRKS